MKKYDRPEIRSMRIPDQHLIPCVFGAYARAKAHIPEIMLGVDPPLSVRARMRGLWRVEPC